MGYEQSFLFCGGKNPPIYFIKNKFMVQPLSENKLKMDVWQYFAIFLGIFGNEVTKECMVFFLMLE
jgi:hypothetical protein